MVDCIKMMDPFTSGHSLMEKQMDKESLSSRMAHMLKEDSMTTCSLRVHTYHKDSCIMASSKTIFSMVKANRLI
jgi:hypothetical protein